MELELSALFSGKDADKERGRERESGGKGAASWPFEIVAGTKCVHANLVRYADIHTHDTVIRAKWEGNNSAPRTQQNMPVRKKFFIFHFGYVSMVKILAVWVCAQSSGESLLQSRQLEWKCKARLHVRSLVGNLYGRSDCGENTVRSVCICVCVETCDRNASQEFHSAVLQNTNVCVCVCACVWSWRLLRMPISDNHLNKNK